MRDRPKLDRIGVQRAYDVLQVGTLRGAGCEVIRAERVSGAGSTEPNTVLDSLRRGDMPVLTRIDGLADRDAAGSGRGQPQNVRPVSTM